MRIHIRYADIKSDVGKVLGLTVRSGRRIFIQRGLGKKRTFEVLMHELTHASLIQLSIKRSHINHERIAKQVGRYAVKTAWKRRQYE